MATNITTSKISTDDVEVKTLVATSKITSSDTETKSLEVTDSLTLGDTPKESVKELFTDYIVEEGTKTSTDDALGELEWNYRKWKNGTMELWVNSPVLSSVALTTNVATNTYSNSTWRGKQITFPIEFAEAPIASGSLSTSSFTNLQLSGTSETYVTARAFQNFSATVSGFRLRLYIIGKYDTTESEG